MKFLPLAAAALVATLATASAQAARSDADVIAAQKPSYPLTTCVVSGEALGGGTMAPIDIVHEGRLVSFCCKGCTKDFNKDPAAYLAKIDAAVVAAQKAAYPLSTCPVSGEALDEHPIQMVYGTRLVELCCAGCKKDFAKTPGKFMQAVDAAYIEALSKTYPLTTCPISGEPLGDKPVKTLHGVQLVEFCCNKCVREFEKNPAPVLEKLAAARGAAPARAAKPAGRMDHDEDGDKEHEEHEGRGGDG